MILSSRQDSRRLWRSRWRRRRERGRGLRRSRCREPSRWVPQLNTVYAIPVGVTIYRSCSRWQDAGLTRAPSYQEEWGPGPEEDTGRRLGAWGTEAGQRRRHMEERLPWHRQEACRGSRPQPTRWHRRWATWEQVRCCAATFLILVITGICSVSLLFVTTHYSRRTGSKGQWLS